jgi:hypothetical protein
MSAKCMTYLTNTINDNITLYYVTPSYKHPTPQLHLNTQHHYMDHVYTRKTWGFTSTIQFQNNCNKIPWDICCKNSHTLKYRKKKILLGNTQSF